MDFKNFIDYFKSKKVYSLALYQADEQLSVNGLLISIKEKEELDIVEKINFEDLQEFLKTADTNYPVVFNFYGKSSNSKKVEKKRGYIQKVLFRSDPDDFYFYEVQQSDSVFVSMARREVLDNLLSVFSDNDLYVLDFTIGPFPLYMVHRSFPKFKELCNRDHLLVFDKELVSFQERKEPLRETYTIENEDFDQKNLPAFANFLSYSYETKNNEPVNLRLKSNIEEFKFKVWFQKFGIAAVGLMLICLAVSHFTKEYYQQKLMELKQESLYMQTRVTHIKNLEKEIKDKKEILNASGFNAIGFLSKYSSEIVNDVPKEIVLNLLEVQPLTNRIKPNEIILLKNEFIEIGGISSSELAFNNWIQQLTKKKWIKKLEISNYEKMKNNLNEFKLMLQINAK